ncbi:succinyl-CoA:acetate/propanoyl-CoA:succinate CoA transferase-like [Tachypleus tridentatus]|uniref:succinyl-CoA:acetate/propanoyl-CoA:succinate CoA transferase-like n=1 Tax=Tachypleus tridentatus TaxID=6853 RepID=UPI003FD50D8B
MGIAFNRINFTFRSFLRQNLLSSRIIKRTFYGYSKEPFQPLNREPKWMSAEEAVQIIKSGDTVFLQGIAATPRKLVPAMVEHAKKEKLKNITVCHIHTEGAAEYNHPDCEGIFRSNSFFVGGNCREAINSGRGDFVPIFLGEIPFLFHREIVKPDVALVQVTPPDNHGYCSLGSSVDCTRAAVQHSKVIIGQVNPRLPRTFGDGLIHKSHFDALVEGQLELPELKPPKLTDVEVTIGKLIADNLVVDGATLQMGIGSIPDAVLASLKGHKDLGVHSEMFSDGVVDLVESGCITNHQKKIQPGKIVGSLTFGTRRFYDFMDNNPFIMMMGAEYVNSIPVIASNPKVTAINSCIEIDLTGQVVSDSIGTRIYSGFGGQVDFLRGAAVCHDGLGKPILAMPSLSSKGDSKITPFIKQGAGVVTTRAHVHYVMTEYGIAFLFGKNIRQRAHALIEIAHPTHRESLEKAAFERLKCMPSP